VHVVADRATYSRNVQVLIGLTSSQRVVEIRLVPCRRGLQAGAVHHVSGHAHPLPLSGNMGDNGADAGPLGPPGNDVTRRFILIHSFIETQRTALSALTTIHHFSRSLPQSPFTAAPPVAGAGPGWGVALLGTRRPQTQVGGRQYYATARGHNDPTLCKSMCGFSPVELDAIVELARERVERPMDPRMHRSVEMNELRRPRRRVCSAFEMIFLTLVLLRGGDEGALLDYKFELLWTIHTGIVAVAEWYNFRIPTGAANLDRCLQYWRVPRDGQQLFFPLHSFPP